MLNTPRFAIRWIHLRFAQDGVSYFFHKKRLFLIQETLRRLPTLKIAVIY